MDFGMLVDQRISSSISNICVCTQMWVLVGGTCVYTCVCVWFWFHLANSDLVYRNYSLSISQSISSDRIVSCTSLPSVQLFQYQPVLRVFPCRIVLADQPIRLFSGLNINLFAADGLSLPRKRITTWFFLSWSIRSKLLRPFDEMSYFEYCPLNLEIKNNSKSDSWHLS